MSGEKPPAPPAWATALLVLASLVLSLGLAEGFLRLFRPQTLAFSWLSDEGLWLHLPGRTVVYQRSEFEVPVRINALGFRDDEWAIPKPPGTFRILLLGDSFTEGAQVPDDDLFATRIERAFAGSAPRVEVLNAGVSGYGTADSLAVLETWGPRVQPDLVLLAFCLQNDPMNDRLGRCRLQEGRLACDPWPVKAGWSLRFARMKSWLGSVSHLYQTARAATAEMSLDRIGLRAAVAQSAPSEPFDSDRHLAPPPAYLVNAYALSEALLAAMRDRAAALGAPLWIALVPVREQVRPDEWQAVERRFGAAAVDRAAPQRALAEIGARLGLRVVDPYARFLERGEDALYYRFDAHFAPAGHAVFADSVVAALRDAGLPGPAGVQQAAGAASAAP